MKRLHSKAEYLKPTTKIVIMPGGTILADDENWSLNQTPEGGGGEVLPDDELAKKFDWDFSHDWNSDWNHEWEE
ncbi:MAG: hypothetical protein J6N73_07895 [Prevotella sp.]|nr:hypothetical protein [Prevotella sp.]